MEFNTMVFECKYQTLIGLYNYLIRNDMYLTNYAEEIEDYEQLIDLVKLYLIEIKKLDDRSELNSKLDSKLFSITQIMSYEDIENFIENNLKNQYMSLKQRLLQYDASKNNDVYLLKVCKLNTLANIYYIVNGLLEVKKIENQKEKTYE